DGDTPLSQQIVNFVESNGARWSARREAVLRAAAAALEAAEAIQASGQDRRLMEIQGYFDEFNLNIKLLHQGEPLPLTMTSTAHPSNLLDMDDSEFSQALDQTLSGISHVLLKRLADRLSSGSEQSHSWLRLH